MPSDRLRGRLRDRRLVIAGKEIRGLSREKTIVLALAIQLFVAAFSSFLVVGLVSLYDPGEVEGGEIEAAVTGEAADRLLEAAAEHDRVGTTEYEDATAARAAFDRGEADVAFVVTPDGDRLRVATLVPDANVETTLYVAEARTVLETLERHERSDRSDHLESSLLAPPGDADGSPFYEFTYTVLLPLLVILPAFISGSITVDSITEEVDRGTLELLRVAPVSLVDVIDGKALATIGIVPPQVAAWLWLVGRGGSPIADPAWIVLLATALATLVVILAATTAVLSPDRRSGQFLYSVGVIALFAGATVLPYGPINAIARLSIGSADLATYAVVIAVCLAAIVGYAALRRLVAEVDPETL